jgi:membrane associated rhomboid family serine protease
MRFNPYNNPFAQQRPSFSKAIISFLKKPTLFNRIIALFVISYMMFLITWLYMYLFAVPLKLGETQYTFFVKYLSLSGFMEKNMEQPWVFASHFILYTGFFKLLYHIIIIAVFGKLFFEYWGNLRFLFLLIASASIGVAAYVYTPAIFPATLEMHEQSNFFGAGAFVFALAAYMYAYIPKYTFVYMMLIRIKLKYIVVVILVVELLLMNKENPGMSVAHLAAAIFGAVFALVSKFIKTQKAAKPRMKVRKQKTKNKQYTNITQQLNDEEYNMLKNQKQNKLDGILDKISKSGYGSLTKEEKDFLFIESKQ